MNQAMEFYDKYSEYPTNILLESRKSQDFEHPAITICFRNSMSAKDFCSNYSDLCEKPNDLDEFCRLHPDFCAENKSALVIPKHGYFTSYSREVEKTSQRLLLNDSEHLMPFDKPSGVVTTFIRIDSYRFIKCYSVNLQLDQCSPEPPKIYLDIKNKEQFLDEYPLTIRALETFYPWGKQSVIVDFHSPFVPTNILMDGQIITSGFVHVFNVLLEREEILLPPPYQTSCRNYTVKTKACNETKTGNPSSDQMCLELCRSEFYMAYIECDEGLTMQPSIDNLCYYDREIEITDEQYDQLIERRRECELKCNPDCRKMMYQYKTTRWRNEDFFSRSRHFSETVGIFFAETCSSIRKGRAVQPRWWPYWMLAWNLCLGFYWNHGEHFQERNEIQTEEETEKDVRNRQHLTA